MPASRSVVFALIALSALSAAIPTPAAAQAQPPTVLRYDFRMVDGQMQALVADYALPGASLRLNVHGHRVYQRSFGAYTAGTRVRIGSATKWLSALAIARLVEQGRLRWDHSIGDFFPDAPPGKRGITLAQLFSHTSGLPADESLCTSRPSLDFAGCTALILDQPLVGPPGQVFIYGNNSMQVAGRMAELATGKAWDDIFLDEMVRPLGLTATDFSTASTAPGYVRNPHPRVAGGIRSTLEDYGRVLDMVLADGCLDSILFNTCLPAQRFLRRETLAYMAQDRSVGTLRLYVPPTVRGEGYGIGQWIHPSDPGIVSSPGTFGFTPWVDRRSGLAGVLLVNDDVVRLAPATAAIRAQVAAVVNAPPSRHAPVLPARRVAPPAGLPPAGVPPAGRPPSGRMPTPGTGRGGRAQSAAERRR